MEAGDGLIIKMSGTVSRDKKSFDIWMPGRHRQRGSRRSSTGGSTRPSSRSGNRQKFQISRQIF